MPFGLTQRGRISDAKNGVRFSFFSFPLSLFISSKRHQDFVGIVTARRSDETHILASLPTARKNVISFSEAFPRGYVARYVMSVRISFLSPFPRSPSSLSSFLSFLFYFSPTLSMGNRLTSTLQPELRHERSGDLGTVYLIHAAMKSLTTD